jgi:4-amino-4-deoxy-L-arabinose transferase-like glycosyltransferase
METNINRRKEFWIFLALICVLYLGLGVFNTILLRPQSIHQWAQCDRASVALNYAQESMNFFLPRVHNLDNGTGITGLEFPIVNYSVACLYKIFGFHEMIYRMFVLIIYSTGLYYAFLIAKKFLHNFYFSIGVVLLFACSPLLAYYSSNFLPEPVSLGLIFIAWYYLIKSISLNNTKNHLMLWAIFFCLAALIKVSALINLPAMLAYFYFNQQHGSRIKKSLPFFVYAILSVGLVFSWYRYAMYLSDIQHSEMFLLQSRPPQSVKEFLEVWDEVYRVWWERVYENIILFILLGSLFVYSLFFKRRDKILSIISISLLFSVAGFLYFMWLQLQHHDYYLIPLYILIFFLMLLSIEFLKKLLWRWNSLLISLILISGISFQFAMAKNHVRTSYKIDSWKYGSAHFNNYFDFESTLEVVGVAKKDKVISIFDHSPEISLYLLNRKGVTVAYRKHKEVFEKYLLSGHFKYVIYNLESNFDEFSFSALEYPLKEIYNNGIIVIYLINSNNNFQEKDSTTPLLLSPWN